MRPIRSLKFQILIHYMAVVAVTAGAVFAVMYLGFRQGFEDWMIRSNRYLARAVLRHLSHGLERGARSAGRLAARLTAARGRPEERQRLLDEFLMASESYSNAYLFDVSGSFVMASYQPGSESRRDHSGENYHRYPGPFPPVADRVAGSGKPAFTPVFYSGSGRPQVAYVLPLPGPGGRTAEILSLAIYAVSDDVNTWIQELQPGRQGYIALLDAQGRALALTGSLPPSLASATTRPVTAFAAHGPAEHIGTMVLDGREDLVIRETMEATQMRVWLGLPRSVAYRPLTALHWPAALAVMAALVLALGGTALLVRRIVKPVNELVSGIRRVGEGVLSHRVPTWRDDELGEAAAAFNRMAERLHRDQLIEEVWREVRRP